MADMGGGQLPKEGRDRLLENQKDAGDSPMDVDGTLRTAELKRAPLVAPRMRVVIGDLCKVRAQHPAATT